MKITFGIFAHVDAGKTTFTEQLLYISKAIRNPGRVDHSTSVMDTNEIEKQRGITIFADQSHFTYDDNIFYIIDTPGHVDFISEALRSFEALDYAVCVISASDSVQAHTMTLFNMLREKDIPVFFFINKIDLEGYFVNEVIDDIKEKLSSEVLFLNGHEDIYSEETAQFIAERDLEFLEKYLEASFTNIDLIESVSKLISSSKIYVILSGSALLGKGIKEFLDVFSMLVRTDYRESEKPFSGFVYKIKYDASGSRLTYIKGTRGILKVKDSIGYEKENDEYTEKINEIRKYNGMKYSSESSMGEGDIMAVSGLKKARSKDRITDNVILSTGGENILKPALRSEVNIIDGKDINYVIGKLKILEEEDPMLMVQVYNKDILISVMGKVQLEVLEQLLLDRFDIGVRFLDPKVRYLETIENTVTGYGHFEPLRHYAEVRLRLEPNERGRGIEFINECRTDDLPVNFQHLVKTHVFEKEHKGVLTGADITDIRIILETGLFHNKHTVGGDFREATYRAIRHSLMKAQSVLLEPWYSFEIYTPEGFLGRVISDIQKLGGSFEMKAAKGSNVVISGRGPVAGFLNYSAELTSLSRGAAVAGFVFDRYEKCGRAIEVIEAAAYDPESDMDNPSSSVFCGKGRSFNVKWYEAEKLMHTLG